MCIWARAHTHTHIHTHTFHQARLCFETKPEFNSRTQVSEHLGVGVVANWRTFPGFRAAFDPVRVQWDADPDEFYEHADAIENGKAPTIASELTGD